MSYGSTLTINFLPFFVCLSLGPAENLNAFRIAGTYISFRK